MTGKQLDTTFVRENTQKKKKKPLAFITPHDARTWTFCLVAHRLFLYPCLFFFYVCFLCCSCANFFFFVLYGANKIHVFAGSFLNSFFTRERVWLFAGCFSFVRVAAENALPPFTHTQGTVKVQFFFFRDFFERKRPDQKKKNEKRTSFCFLWSYLGHWHTHAHVHTCSKRNKHREREKKKLIKVSTKSQQAKATREIQ